MKRVWGVVKEMFARSDNLERGQGMFRMVASTVVLGVISWRIWAGSLELSWALAPSFAYYLFALAWQADSVLSPQRRTARVMSGIVADPVLIAYTGLLLGPSFALFIFALVSAPMGNGLRFGKAFMLPSAIMCLGGLLVLLFWDPGYDPAYQAACLGCYAMAMAVAWKAVDAMERRRALLVGMAMRDGLTGLPNRRMFMELLSKMLKGSGRTGHFIACVFIDLDGFKKVNDQLGHKAGDDLIRKVGEGLARVTRGGDVVCRLSGDEFCVALDSHKDIEEAMIVARKVLRMIEDIGSVEAGAVDVSASVGVAMSEPGEEMSADALISRADQAMYQAKRAGKRRVSKWAAV